MKTSLTDEEQLIVNTDLSLIYVKSRAELFKDGLR